MASDVSHIAVSTSFPSFLIYLVSFKFIFSFSFKVCKYFLEAVEKKQYGWFWDCPNGGKDCHYRHALPPGYVLKSQMKALLEEESEKISIEEQIENEVLLTKAVILLV